MKWDWAVATHRELVKGVVKKKIYGRIRVASTHPSLGYEVIFCCEPKDNTICETCKFKYKCFTDEEIEVVFKGKTLGIFPDWWKKPRPDEEELELLLFGKKVNLLKLRSIPSIRNSKYYPTPT